MKKKNTGKNGTLAGVFRKHCIVITCCVAILIIAATVVVNNVLTEPSAKTMLVTDLPTAIKVMDDEGMNRIQPYLKDNLVLKVTEQLGGSSTKQEFLEAYLKLDTNDDLVEAIIDAGDNAERQRLPE